jgi:hypothetical protein
MTRPYVLDHQRILRDKRLADALAAIAEYRDAHGAERRWWRGHALACIREFKVRHLIPEAAAFRAAVAASKARQRRAA